MMFLRSYILIVVILLAFSLLSYLIAIERISDSVEQLNTTVLDGISTTMDNQFREIEQLAFRLTSLGTTMKLAYLDKDNVDYYPEMTRFVKNLWALWLENDPLALRLYIYFARANIIASPATFYDFDTFSTQFFRYDDLSPDDFSELLLRSDHHMHYLPVTQVWLNDEVGTPRMRDLIMYVYHLRSQRSVEQPPGAIFFMIDTHQISAMLRHLEIGDGGLAAVLDDQMRIVAMLDNNSGISSSQISRIAEGDLAGIPGRMLVSTVSDHNGWTYLALGNPAVVMKPVIALQRIFIVLFLASLIGGMIMALSMARKRSLPLFYLACRLNPDAGTEKQVTTGSVKAYRTIEQGVEQMLQSNLTLQEKLREMNPAILAAFVHQLLNGDYINAEEMAEAAMRYDIRLPPQPYRLVSFRVPQIKALYGQPREEVLRAMVAQEAVAECLHYLIDGPLLLYKASVDETIWIFSVAEHKGEAGLLDLLDKVAKWFGEHKVTMSIRYSRQFTDLSDSWWELAQLRYASQHGGSDPSRSSIEYAWRDPDMADSQYMMLVELMISSMYHLGDERMLARFLEIVRREIFDEGKIDDGSRHDLVSQFQKLAVKLSGQPDLPGEEQEGPDGMFARISNILIETCRQTSLARKKSGSFLLHKILQFIDQNLYCPDLSMTMIADAMNISENYLSRFFKEQTGDTLANFIEQGRIQQSQQLLLQTVLTVSDIAARVGYNSDHVFRRAFRRVTGLSPNEYREKNSDSGPLSINRS